MQGKLTIFSAPSGSGKSTIINYLLQQNLNLAFSISATSRAPRGNERNGVEYYFMSPEEFKTKISNNEFLEYEEVYADKFYGPLTCALSLFIQSPSVEVLRLRLTYRVTDAPDVIECRLNKAEYELSFASQFDIVIVNDNLEDAQKQALQAIQNFTAH